MGIEKRDLTSTREVDSLGLSCNYALVIYKFAKVCFWGQLARLKETVQNISHTGH